CYRPPSAFILSSSVSFVVDLCTPSPGWTSCATARKHTMDLAVSLLLALVASVPDRPQGASEFAEVRAILQTHCIDCHGAEGAEAGLRADIGMGLLVGGDTGPAVVPGKS